MGENAYKQFGPFVYGDPRFLAGGSAARNFVGKDSYDDNDIQLNDGSVVCPPDVPEKSLCDAMSNLGQKLASTKCGYHGCKTMNCFVSSKDLEFPTLGVELETIMNEASSDMAKAWSRQLYSNWIHAENDGSLDQAHKGTYGYEIVTSVLPARLYRNLEVWTGLQNLVTPFVHSYSEASTGLHVHVGMSYFEDTKFSYLERRDRRFLGKALATRIYYTVVPRSFAQRVFLRSSCLCYCHESNDRSLTKRTSECSARAFVDDVIAEILDESPDVESSWAAFAEAMLEHKSDREMKWSDRLLKSYSEVCPTQFISSNYSLPCGHNTEVNASPNLTLEFRRGKGTTNALSIHRMVEFCALTVMFTKEVLENPGMTVSTREFLGYVIDNTKSNALRKLAEAERRQSGYVEKEEDRKCA